MPKRLSPQKRDLGNVFTLGRGGTADAQAKKLLTREEAERSALGLSPVSENQDLSKLYASLGASAATRTVGAGPNRSPQVTFDRGLFSNIASANDQARADAGLSTRQVTTSAKDIRNRPFNRGPARQISQAQSQIDAIPGLSTLLATLQDTQKSSQGIVEPRKTSEGFKFKSGAGAANAQTKPILDKTLALLGISSLGDLKRDDYGRTGDKRVDAAGQRARGILDSAIGKQESNTRAQTIRDTLVANSNRAQRDVRAINASIFSGRRQRRGSSTQLPQIALAGLANYRS